MGKININTEGTLTKSPETRKD